MPPEAVELVQEQPAEVSLKGQVDVADGNPLLQDLVAIDVGIELGDRGAEQRIDARQLRPFPAGLQELLEILSEERDVAAAAVLQPEGEAARVAQARDRGRRESERDGFGNARGKSAV